MDLKKIMIGLALGATVFAGCGDDDDDTTTDTTGGVDMGPPAMCDDAGEAVTYRLSELTIPTPGAPNGQNVDGLGTGICGGDDYNGGIDNALIDLAVTLPNLGDVNLQAEIDAGLNCEAGSTTCERLDLFMNIATGTNCVTIALTDGEGTALADTFAATLDGSGNMVGRVEDLSLSIPYRTDAGTSVSIDLAVSNVIVTGTLSASAVSNIVIGGYLEKSSFEATLMTLVPLISQDITFESVAGILETLYDVQVPTGGDCLGLSVGLTAAGEVVTP